MPRTLPTAMACIAAAAFAATLGAATESQAAPGPAQRGRAIAQTNCSACHAIGRKGASTNPKSPPFRELAQRYPLDNLQEALAEGITVGHEGIEMPEFQLAPKQVDDLIAYIRSITPRRGK